MTLANFNRSEFLANYWQSKPLVIRNAFSNPFWIDPNDLAGLACEEGVESRIIQQIDSRWGVEHGPFDDECFQQLPTSNWTLLVQAVDQWIPEVREILNSFDFLPSWRLDDIMVSYAPIGGTVSQHFDYYDVFLIQGEGSRRWQVGQRCGPDSELLPDTPVKILKHFEPTLDVVLSPGDILYVPAGFAHLGVSTEDSLTYSVGVRAPSVRDMVDGIATTLLESELPEDQRYQDTPSSLAAAAGEIPADAIKQIKDKLLEALADDSIIEKWFGRYVTEKKYPDLEFDDAFDADWMKKVKIGALLEKHPASRFAYSECDACFLYVDGESMACDVELAKVLANSFEINALRLIEQLEQEKNQIVVEHLLRSGALRFRD